MDPNPRARAAYRRHRRPGPAVAARPLPPARHSATGWTTRDDAADALGIPRSVAAFHLDKLAEAGVVDVALRAHRWPHRTRRGRPSKLYRPAQDEIAASVPDRRYDLAGSLLADCRRRSRRTRAHRSRDCLRVIARTAGGCSASRPPSPASRATNRDDRRAAIIAVLERHGYQPVHRRATTRSPSPTARSTASPNNNASSSAE